MNQFERFFQSNYVVSQRFSTRKHHSFGRKQSYCCNADSAQILVVCRLKGILVPCTSYNLCPGLYQILTASKIVRNLAGSPTARSLHTTWRPDLSNNSTVRHSFWLPFWSFWRNQTMFSRDPVRMVVFEARNCWHGASAGARMSPWAPDWVPGCWCCKPQSHQSLLQQATIKHMCDKQSKGQEIWMMWHIPDHPNLPKHNQIGNIFDVAILRKSRCAELGHGSQIWSNLNCMCWAACLQIVIMLASIREKLQTLEDAQHCCGKVWH